MPLIKRCSTKAFGKNIGAELKAGKPQKQAVAIGFSQLKKSCGVETDKRLTPSEIVARGKRNESQDSLGLKSLLSDVCGLVGVESRVLGEKKDDSGWKWHGPKYKDMAELQNALKQEKFKLDDYISVGGIDYMMVEYGAMGTTKYGPHTTASKELTYADWDTLGKELVFNLEDKTIESYDPANIDWAASGFQPRKKKVAEAAEGPWTFTSNSTGYMLYKDGVPMGGARTLGTATHTTDGRIRHWRNKRADIKMFADQGRTECARRNAAEKVNMGEAKERDIPKIKKGDLVMYHTKVKGPNAIGVVTNMESLQGDKAVRRAEVQFRDFTQGYELSALRLATKAEKDAWLKLVGGEIPPVMAKLMESAKSGKDNAKVAIQYAENAVRDLFLQKYPKGMTSKEKENEFVSPALTKAHGRWGLNIAWANLVKERYIEKKGDKWVWGFNPANMTEAAESKRTVGKKPIMSWDTNQIAEDRVNDIMENPGDNLHVFDENDEFVDAWEESGQDTKKFIALLKKKDLYDEFEKLARENAYQDSDQYEVEWDSLKEYLTEKMKEKNPDGYWRADMSNFGWRGVSGSKYFEADNGEKLLQEILPKTDCTFYIYDFGKDGLAINNFHHDSPMGKEWYYIVPVKQVEFENEGPVSLAKEVQVGIDNGDFYTGFHSKSGPVSGTREEIRAHVIKALEGQAKAKAEDIKPEEFTKGDTFEAVSLELVFSDKSKLDVSLEIGLKDIGDGQYRSEAADFVNTDVNDSGFKEESIQEDALGSPGDLLDAAIVDVMKSGRIKNDDDLHRWAEENKYDVHKVETAIYRLFQGLLVGSKTKTEADRPWKPDYDDVDVNAKIDPTKFDPFEKSVIEKLMIGGVPKAKAVVVFINTFSEKGDDQLSPYMLELKTMLKEKGMLTEADEYGKGLRKHTPWGQSDGESELADGIVSVSTPGHGGIWLSPERQKQLNWSKNFLKNPTWWEEDSDWAIPYYFFRDDIGAAGKAYEFEKNLVIAIDTIKRHHPEFAKRENLTEEKLVETGEADQDYDTEFFDEIVKQLAAAGYRGASHREFDKYQGVYLKVPGVDTFWIKDFFTRGEISDRYKAKPYRTAILTNPQGEEVSSSQGDYFQLPKDYVFKGFTLKLVKQNGESVTKKNPKLSELPDLMDVMHTFVYKPGTSTEHTVFYPEHDNNVEIEVVKDGDGKVQAAGLIRYCKTHKLKKEAMGESWVGND